MAYKLTDEQKVKANFIRSFNKNIENAAKTFGKSSEIYMNLVSFANIHGLTSSKSNFDFYQASSSKSVLNAINIDDIVKDYYKDDTKVIKPVYNVAQKKEVATKQIKAKAKMGKKETYKTIIKIMEDTNLVVSNYKDAKEIATPQEYDKLLGIMEDFRNNKITSEQYDYMKQLASEDRIIIGGKIIDKSTGEILYDKKSRTHKIYSPDEL